MGALLRFLEALWRLGRQIELSVGTFTLVIVLSLATGVLNTLLLALINHSLAVASRPGASLILLFALACLVLPLARVLSQSLLLRLGGKTVYSVRMALCRRVLAAPLRRLEELGSHRLLATLTSDVETVTEAILNVPGLIMQLAILSSCLLYLGWLSWQALSVLLVFLALGLLSYQLPVRAALRHLERFRREWDSLVKHLEALIGGAKELKLHRERREDFLSKVLAASAAAQVRHAIRGNTIFVIAINWGQILYFIAIGLVLFLMPSYSQLPREALIGYAMTILYLRSSFDSILGLLPTMGSANIALSAVEALGLELDQSAPEPTAEPPTGDQGRFTTLELRGVTHTFRGENQDLDFVLGPIDLVLRPAEVVFLVGGNGSGKTTLAKLIVGLYGPESGQIYRDGEPVVDRDRYRQLFSAVFSDFFLFESLLGIERENLDARTRFYLSKLGLDHKVTIEAGRLSTLDLSQGQRKRLALLTAYLEDRPVYLFDEWAADQDPSFKEVFYRELVPELRARGKLVIVISHDDRYYGSGDRLVKLADGKIENAEGATPPA